MSDVVVDIDMGNTRAKWRVSVDGAESYYAEPYSDGVWLKALSELSQVKRVRVCCVAGQEKRQGLIALCQQQWQVSPEFAVSEALCASVVNAYEQPATLGVDRWLAMLAAYEQVRGACLVVDCGSALTVDLLSGGGKHLGGYITPGMQLMRRSLFQDTAAVKVLELGESQGLEPGVNTQLAVNNGLLLMVVALLEKAGQQLERLEGVEPTIILTGGDAQLLLPHVSSTACGVEPHLVLSGLSIALP